MTGETLKEVQLKTLELAKLSSAHGVNKIISRQNLIERITWAVCFLTAIAVCSYFVIFNIVEYFSFHVIRKTRFEVDNPTLFPAVAICNSNPYVTKDAFDFLIDFVERNSNYTLYSAFPNQSKLDYLNKILLHDKELIDLLEFNALNMNETTKQKFGFPIDRMIISCRYANEECDLSDFGWFYDRDYGNCYVFNAINKFTVRSEGLFYGLQLEVFAGYEKYLPVYKHGYGIKVMIYNQTIDTRHSFFLDKISVQTNSEIFIGMRRIKVQELERPYSECVTHQDLAASYNLEVFTDFNLQINRNTVNGLTKL